MRIVELKLDDLTAAFTKESGSLRDVLGQTVVDIHHIGSTAIPGLLAKPIVDILLVVASLDKLDLRTEHLESIGYEARGENRLPGRRYFRKVGHVRTHHIHAYEHGHPDIHLHLAFRDYLRARPEAASRNEQVKIDQARRCRGSPERYSDGKAAVIRILEDEALLWRQVASRCCPSGESSLKPECVGKLEALGLYGYAFFHSCDDTSSGDYSEISRQLPLQGGNV